MCGAFLSYENFASLIAFAYLLKRDVIFLGYDIYYVRTAETALTSSHAGTHAALDSVHCVARKASSHGVEDFAFADFFAAADDNAVVRI